MLAPLRVDARGMRCPWPVLRFAKAVREAGEGQSVEMVADDPKAPDEIAALALAQGWDVSCVEVEDGFSFAYQKKS